MFCWFISRKRTFVNNHAPWRKLTVWREIELVLFVSIISFMCTTYSLYFLYMVVICALWTYTVRSTTTTDLLSLLLSLLILLWQVQSTTTDLLPVLLSLLILMWQVQSTTTDLLPLLLSLLILLWQVLSTTTDLLPVLLSLLILLWQVLSTTTDLLPVLLSLLILLWQVLSTRTDLLPVLLSLLILLWQVLSTTTDLLPVLLSVLIRDGNGQGPFQLKWSGSRGRLGAGGVRGQGPGGGWKGACPLSENEFCTFWSQNLAPPGKKSVKLSDNLALKIIITSSISWIKIRKKIVLGRRYMMTWTFIIITPWKKFSKSAFCQKISVFTSKWAFSCLLFLMLWIFAWNWAKQSPLQGWVLH